MQRALRKEINAANIELAKRKKIVAQREKQEELRILEYLEEKDRREEAYQREMQKIKAEKEREIAMVRAQQQRSIDTQSQRDELMARRAAVRRSFYTCTLSTKSCAR